jgi:Zn-dependent peptidase ImmA (M78 family)
MDLDKLLQIKSDYQPMSAGNYDLSDVYNHGEKIASDIDMSRNFDLYQLIQCNGGTIHHIDLASFKMHNDIFENSIYVHDEKKFDIILPLYAPLVEIRYTIAHELAHYILHSQPAKCYARRNGGEMIEKEADWFTLGFLMPSNLFDPVCDKYNNDPYELSIAFLVPINVVRARIDCRNLIKKPNK